VTTIIDENGFPWWVEGFQRKPVWFSTAREVCDILGIKHSANAVTSLDEDEKQMVSLACFMGRTSSSGGNPTRVIINEPEVYQLIQKFSFSGYGHMEES